MGLVRVASVALLLAFTVRHVRAAEAAPPEWRARLATFEREALREQQKLDLDWNPWALRQRFPAPKLAASARTPVACPGAVVELAFEGALLPGSLVVVASAQASLEEARPTEQGWEGTLRIAADAAPERVDLLAVSPVSAERQRIPAVVIGCEQEFTVEVGEETLVFRAAFGPKSEQRVEGWWRRGDETLGSRTYVATLESGKLDLLSRPTAAEERAGWDAYHALRRSAPWKDAKARVERSAQAAGACRSRPEPEVPECVRAAEDERQAAEKALQAMDAQDSVEDHPFGCRSVTLMRMEHGAVSGHAMACRGHPALAAFAARGRYQPR